MEHRDVSYLIYEATQARHERTLKRLIIALIISVILIFASNLAWIYCWMQYDYVVTTEDYSVDFDSSGGGNNNYIGNDGDIVNGEDARN